MTTGTKLNADLQRRLNEAGEDPLADQLASADLAEADNIGAMPWREALRQYSGYIHFSKAPYYQRRYQQPRPMGKYGNAPGIYFYDGHTLLYGDVGGNIFASGRPYFIIADIDTTRGFDCGHTSDAEVEQLVDRWRLTRLFETLREAVMNGHRSDVDADHVEDPDDFLAPAHVVEYLRAIFPQEATEAAWLFLLVRALIYKVDEVVQSLIDCNRTLKDRDFPHLTWRSTFMRDFTCVVDADHPDLEGVSVINDDIPRQVIVFDPSIITPVAWGKNARTDDDERYGR